MANAALSDERLLRRVAAGDPEAAYVLLLRHTGLVGWAVRERGLSGGAYAPGLTGEDAEQAGLVGLWRAIVTYRIPEVGASSSAQFTTYAKRVVANAVEDAYRSAHTERQHALNESLSLEDINTPGEGGRRHDPVGGDVERQALDDLEYRASLSHLRSALSDQEYQVLRAHLSGMTYAEVARATGLTYKSVDGAMQRIRRKARSLAAE